jgi:hypothetical protein
MPVAEMIFDRIKCFKLHPQRSKEDVLIQIIITKNFTSP